MGEITNPNNFQQPNYNQAYPQQTQDQAPKKSKTWIFVTIIIIILVVAGYFLFFNKSGNENVSSPNNNGESSSDDNKLTNLLCTDLVSKEKLQEIYGTPDIFYVYYDTYYNGDLERREDNKPYINPYAYYPEEGIICYYNFKGVERIYMNDVEKILDIGSGWMNVTEEMRQEEIRKYKDYFYSGTTSLTCGERKYDPELWLNQSINIINAANKRLENMGENYLFGDQLRAEVEILDIGLASYIYNLKDVNETSGIFEISFITENSLCRVSIEGRGKQETISLAREIETSLNNIEF